MGGTFAGAAFFVVIQPHRHFSGSQLPGDQLGWICAGIVCGAQRCRLTQQGRRAPTAFMEDKS